MIGIVINGHAHYSVSRVSSIFLEKSGRGIIFFPIFLGRSKEQCREVERVRARERRPKDSKEGKNWLRRPAQK